MRHKHKWKVTGEEKETIEYNVRRYIEIMSHGPPEEEKLESKFRNRINQNGRNDTQKSSANTWQTSKEQASE